MRKTRKIISMALTASMMLGATSGLDRIAFAEKLDINSVTLSNTETFEDYEIGVEGTSKFTGTDTETTYNLGNYLTVTIKGAGNCAEVLVDPYTSSKALKLTYSGNGKVEVHNWFKGNTSKANLSATAIARAGYKARFEHNASNSWINRLNALTNANDWYGIAKSYCYGDSLAIEKKDGALLVFAENLSTNYSQAYLSGDIIYNSFTKLRMIEAGGHLYETQGANTNPIARASYVIGEATGKNENYYGKQSSDSPTVLWLDDLDFEVIDYKASEITVGGMDALEKSLTNVPLNSPIDVKMSDEAVDETSKDSFELTDANGSVDFDIVKNGRNFSIYPKAQMPSTTYTLTVKKGIVSKKNKALSTTVDKTISYTTVDDGFSFIGYIEDMNFDDMQEEDFTNSQQYYMDGKLWIYSNTEGDKISVVNDPVTQSNALKLTRAAVNVNTSKISKYNYVFDKAYTTGKLVTTMDIRIKNDNGGCSSFISFGDSNSTGVNTNISNRLYGGYWWAKNSGTEQWTNNSKWDSSVYFPAVMSVDLSKGLFSGEVYRDYGKSTQQLNKKSWNFTDVSDIKYMNLVDFRNMDVTDTGKDSEIYIDNLKIAYYNYKALDVESISMPQNEAEPQNDIIITMNDIVKDAFVTSEYFVVSDEEGTQIPGYTVSKNNNRITISFENGMDFEKTYLINIPSGVESSTNGTLSLQNDYLYRFTTRAKRISKIIGFENFEKYSEGETPVSDNIITSVLDGDSIQVVTDPVTNSKALKMVRNESNVTSRTKTVFQYLFNDTPSTGKVKVTYDIRIESNRGGADSLGSIISSDNSTILDMRLCGDYYVFNDNISGSNFFNVNAVNANGNKQYNSSMYVPMEETVYYANNKIEARSYRFYGTEDQSERKYYVNKSNLKPASLLNFRYMYNGSNTVGAEGDAVIYIDNIVVEHYDYPGVSSVSPANDSIDVQTDAPVTFSLFGDLNKDSVNKDNIKVYENDVLLPEYNVSIDDSNVVTLDFAKQNGKKYTISVSNLVNNGEIPVYMEEPYKFDFTTALAYTTENAEVVTNSVDSKKIDYIATIKNNTQTDKTFDYYIGLYSVLDDGTEKLVAAQLLSDITAPKNYIKEVKATFEKYTDGECIVHGFAWDDMQPLVQKTTVGMPTEE